ncbi:MAG TPA: hypothetical protein VD963_09460 [Phycisphaerales bacterium]|nr:hypothetical protein [Phycisphaerales bacterium]
MPRARSRSARDPFDWARFRSGLATGLTAAITLGLVLGVVLGRGALKARAAQSHALPVRAAFNWPTVVGPGDADAPTTWLDDQTRARLQHIVQTTVTPDPFDAGSLQRAQRALMATGWFSGPCTLRRDRDGLVRVDCRWRVPYAAVRHADRDHLVTIRGELLDRSFEPGLVRLWVIQGAASGPPAPGEPWPGGQVQAALELITFLHRSGATAPALRGVDVSAFTPTGRQLVLITTAGARIVWGGPASAPNPGEERSAVKLRNLSTVLAKPDQAAAPGLVFDVRFARPGWLAAP